jgi:tetratricopeptide (TPR) repeat protein
MDARPKRLASAGKTLNGLGVVYSEQGRLLKAEECFQRAMKLYRKSIPKKHVDVAGTLINLGTIDCDREDVRQTKKKEKIFFHPIFVLFSMVER